MTSLKEKAQKSIIKEIQKRTGVSNVFALPRLKSITVNAGVGRAAVQSSKPEDVVKKVSDELAAIIGQKPVETKAKKSIASFKTREGMTVGLKATLHGNKMWDFLDRFINVALPRTRDFRGISESCVDQGGSLNIGIKDHTVFPEALADAAHTFGFQITIATNSRGREDSLEFFRMLGIPFKK